MINTAKILISSIITAVLLTGCSTAPVQGDRLNTAEELLIDVENILARSSEPNAKLYAKEQLGSANAYLLTLKDNKKVLTKTQLQRYNALLQRASSLQKRVN